ncbi:PRC-barrel domain-containing protein [Streptomyces sp. NPDC002057]|uniref:PRC-barrel domain-containing protein n=1 Tax=Streptomyces sp. NPDC002057 TaxID=3154664 RepID=UPI0033312BB7
MTEQPWSYRSTSGHLAGAVLAGYKVEATDGSIGKVDKHSDVVDDAYLVVDTGVWIFGKEVLLPAGLVSRIDAEERKIYVDASREQVKKSPEFHREPHLGDATYRQHLGLYYGPGGPLA